MRLAATVIVCAGFAFATAAAAQQAPTRTVEDYLCAFAGECGDKPEDEGPEIARDAPETSGARLAWRTEETSAAKPGAAATTVPAIRQRHSAGSALATAAQPPVTRYSKPRTAGGRSAGKATRVAYAALGRADMRLEFELASATLTPQAMREAEVFARFALLPQQTSKRFLIEGHTDSIGGQAYNQELSQRRAEAVAEYLAGLGVDRQRLEVKGYGFAKPLPGRSTRSPANRRVEAVLVR